MKIRLLSYLLLCLATAALRGQIVVAEVILSELLASGGNTLEDTDGDPSDWIELYNRGHATVSLAGWSLSDDPEDPGKWPLPVHDLEAGAFLVVFASGKDRRQPDAELHTNFKLSRAGEFLGLADPSGTFTSAFVPRFPALRVDSSFGLPMARAVTPLLPAGARARLLAPERRSPPNGWTDLDFDDSMWTEVVTGVGFDRSEDGALADLIATDVHELMQGGEREPTASAYLRAPFTLDGKLPSFLQLRVQYDSGFIAFLNGVEVTRRNAAQLRFQVQATANRPPPRAARAEVIPLPVEALREGSNLLAVQALNDDPESTTFLLAPILEAVTVESVVSEPVHFPLPTPGSPNHERGASGVAAPPRLSPPEALFTGTLRLELSAEDPGVSIHYTTDGSEPDDLSPRYDGPFEVTEFTTIKAKAIAADLVPSATVTGTYIAALDEVLSFDSDLPLVVLTTESALDTQFSPVHVRVVEPDDSGRAAWTRAAEFVGAGTIKTRGSSTLGRPKKSYSIEIQDAFGRDRDVTLLDLPEESDWVLYGPHQDGTLLRNVFIYRASQSIGRYAPRSRFCEVFLHQAGAPLARADYVGVYALMEKIKRGSDRVDVAALRPEHGAEPEITGGYLFKRDRTDPGDRGFTAGEESLQYVDPKESEITEPQAAWLKSYLDRMADSMSGPDYGYEEFIDVGSWIDHHLMQEFTKNTDAYEHSTFYFKERGGKVEAGPIWDFNYALGHGRDDPLGWSVNRTWLWWGRLLRDPVYLERYANRWVEMRKGPFRTDRLVAILDAAEERVSEAQARNFERWPESLEEGGWRADVDHLRTWIEERLLAMDDLLVPPPRPIPPGGRVPSGSEVRFEAREGTVFFTTDGTDPRDPDGSPSATARQHDDPLRVTANTSLRVRAQISDTLWTDVLEVSYVTDSLPLVISEIMYAPGSDFASNALEFIEVHNVSTEAVDISDLSFERRPSFNFARSTVTTLPPGAFGVLVKDLEAFATRYQADQIPVPITVLGEFSGSLSNDGQSIRLLGASGEEVFGVNYDATWHPSTAGEGHSLVLAEERVTTLGWTRPEAWRPSAEPGGSPGRDDPSAAAGLQRTGDWSQDGRLNLADAIALLGYLAGRDPNPPCDPGGSAALADVNEDRQADLTDALHLLNYLFLGGPPPAAGTECRAVSGCPPGCVTADL